MPILQGNTYELPIQIKDSEGNFVTPEMIKKASFTFGKIEKNYGELDNVYYDYYQNAWILPLTENETFILKDEVKWQVRFLFIDETIDGTLPKTEYVYSSINKKILTGGN